MTTFLRWLNGWRLFIAAVIIFLAYALLAIAADLHRQSKCLLWDREPSNPDTAIAAILVLFFLCIIAAAAGLIWGISGPRGPVADRGAVTRPAHQPARNTIHRSLALAERMATAHWLTRHRSHPISVHRRLDD